MRGLSAFAIGFSVIALGGVMWQREQSRAEEMSVVRRDFEVKVQLLKREMKQLTSQVNTEHAKVTGQDTAAGRTGNEKGKDDARAASETRGKSGKQPLSPSQPSKATGKKDTPMQKSQPPTGKSTERTVRNKVTGETMKVRSIVLKNEGAGEGVAQKGGRGKETQPEVAQVEQKASASDASPPEQAAPKGSWQAQKPEKVRLYDPKRYAKQQGKKAEWVARKQKALEEAGLSREMAVAEEHRLEAAKHPAWQPLGKVGAVLNAYGNPKYVEEAFRVIENIRRVTDIIQHFTIWTNSNNELVAKEHPMFNKEHMTIRYYEDIKIPPFLDRCPGYFQLPPPVFGSKIAGLAKTWELDKYDTTVVLDGDTHYCNNFDHLFPTKEFNYNLGVATDTFCRYGASKHDPYRNITLTPADSKRREQFAAMQEVNVGFMILRTNDRGIQMLLNKWRDIYAAQTTSKDTCKFYDQDQAAFREAMFVLEGTKFQTARRYFPHDNVCRWGDQVEGCISKAGCVLEGCDVVHCKVAPWAKHMTREEMLQKGKKLQK